MLKQLTSVQHPLIKHLVKVRQNSDYRYDHASVLIEGYTMVQEVGKKTSLKIVLTTDEALIPKGIKAKEVLVVSDAIIKKISGLEVSEGILAEAPLPPQATFKKCQRLLVCDGVSDPGNLGTLLRTALAFGWDGAFLLPNSCDPYNEKAVRASRGAVFRLPMAQGTWQQLKEIAESNRLQPYAADLDGTSLEQVHANNGILLVMGNEAHGLSSEGASWCQRVTLPMPGPMESLNVAVAGGILLYALQRKVK